MRNVASRMVYKRFSLSCTEVALVRREKLDFGTGSSVLIQRSRVLSAILFDPLSSADIHSFSRMRLRPHDFVNQGWIPDW